MSASTFSEFRQARRAARQAPVATPYETWMTDVSTSVSQLAHFLAAPALGVIAFIGLVFAVGMHALAALAFAILFAVPAGWFLGRL